MGGIVGGMKAGSENNEVNVAYNAGNITGNQYVGGISGNLVGVNSKIENAYNADNNTVVCEKIVEDTDFNAIKSMANSPALLDESGYPIWQGLTDDAANMDKARYLMEYYSFYTVGSAGKTYYYFVSQKMEDDSTRMGARGLFVKKEPGSALSLIHI